MKLDLLIIEIYEQFYLGELDKESAFERFKSYIESDIDDDLRVKCVNLIGNLDFINDGCYKFLENLLISDSSEGVKCESARLIIRDFLNQGMDPIVWSLEHDISPNYTYFVVEELRNHEKINLQSTLCDVILNSIDNESGSSFRMKNYVNDLNNFIKRKPITAINTDKLIQILLNLKVAKYLDESFNPNGDNIESSHFNGYIRSLWLTNTNIRSFEELKGLEHLKMLEELTIIGTQIEEIKGLDKLTTLRSLKILNNLIKEIKGIETITKLDTLNLSNNQITEIKGLETLINLIELKLGDNDTHFSVKNFNKITEIKGLESLSNLMELHIPHNSIKEIKNLDNLTKLEMLVLNDNKIKKITGLEKSENLMYLILQNNQISKIEGLENLEYLGALDLSNNQISKLEGLENKRYLNNLILSHNNITEIDGIENLENLKMLDLSYNEINELKGLEKLKNLKKLIINDNPLRKNEIPKKLVKGIKIQI